MASRNSSIVHHASIAIARARRTRSLAFVDAMAAWTTMSAREDVMTRFPYRSRDERFATSNAMHVQYCQLYYQRLIALGARARASERARASDGELESETNARKMRTVLELVENERCVVIGTMYKHMKRKPGILDEYVKAAKDGKEDEGETHDREGTYTSADDWLELEDESARLRVIGLDASKFVTGVVVACEGRAVRGDFVCEGEVMTPQARIRERKCANGGQDAFIVLVSGFEIDADDVEGGMRRQMFVDFITGACGDDDDLDMSSKICRVVVAGGTMKRSEATDDDGSAAARTLKEFDATLTELVSAVAVDVMSGKSDPSNQAMPQQKLHPVYFPQASRYESALHAVTNPHDFTIGETSFLGTSGQNVEDVLKCSDLGDEVSSTFMGDDAAKRAVVALKATLRWQHIAPSAPDTLACYPFKDRDPFVIETTPDVYFAGCQDAFGCERVLHPGGGETMVISVPKFSITGTVLLVNVSTLHVTPMTFECS